MEAMVMEAMAMEAMVMEAMAMVAMDTDAVPSRLLKGMTPRQKCLPSLMPIPTISCLNSVTQCVFMSNWAS